VQSFSSGRSGAELVDLVINRAGLAALDLMDLIVLKEA
jgi:hypothetical protein